MESMRFIADGARIELNTEMGVIHIDIPRGTRIEVTTETRSGDYVVHGPDGSPPLTRVGPPSFRIGMDATPILGAGRIRTWINDGPEIDSGGGS